MECNNKTHRVRNQFSRKSPDMVIDVTSPYRASRPSRVSREMIICAPRTVRLPSVPAVAHLSLYFRAGPDRFESLNEKGSYEAAIEQIDVYLPHRREYNSNRL